MRIAFAVVLAIVVGTVALLVAMSGHTAIQVNPVVTGIGFSTPVTVRLTNPHGVREVRGMVTQGGVGVRTPYSSPAAPPRACSGTGAKRRAR